MKIVITIVVLVVWIIMYTFVYQRAIEPLRAKSREYEKMQREYLHNNEMQASKKCYIKSFWYFFVSACIQIAVLLPFYLIAIDIAKMF